MEDKVSYANMLEIPVETCSIKTTNTTTKKRAKPKKINHEAVKEELLTKINSFEEEKTYQPIEQPIEERPSTFQSVNNQGYVERKPFKISIIGFQLFLIGALVLTILITNSVYPNSGLNVFMRGIFGNDKVEEVVVDEREYQEFSPVINGDAEVSMQDGIMTLTGEGSVYSAVSGKITSVLQEDDGSYTVNIEHSKKFNSVLTGLDRVYVKEGEQIFNTIPVGYVEDSASMCFKNQEGDIIDDYKVVEDSVVWVE